MGNDGGTIPSRTEILAFSLKKLNGGKERDERNASLSLDAFKYCRLSKKPLRKPVVGDAMGMLYNKEDVLLYLLDKKKDKEKEVSINIKSINDVVQLNVQLENGKLTCPLSNKTLDIDENVETGKLNFTDVQFSYLVPCGCVMNSKLLKEVVGDKDKVEGKCPVCSTSFKMCDVIDIYPYDSKSRKRLEDRMKMLKAKGYYHNLKERKTKKRKVMQDKEAGATTVKKVKT